MAIAGRPASAMPLPRSEIAREDLAMRFVVETKSRGFDVMDSAAVPREEGYWCFCVNEQRAQTIANLLNDRDLEGALTAAMMEALSVVQRRQ